MDCAWIDCIVFPLSMHKQLLYVKKNNFKLFPNPTIGSFNISFNDSKLHTLEIYDSNGKIISIMENQRKHLSLILKNILRTYIKVCQKKSYKIGKQ